VRNIGVLQVSDSQYAQDAWRAGASPYSRTIQHTANQLDLFQTFRCTNHIVYL